ncbi:MAG TPA: chemotaxis-specific protein-glutamate methyltransferase CheB [Thiopseudomonas sp.]|nr:chemotaxis-specific protein-glutamate methyltransferase CheB [Thiopseudomonas sp.]
MMAAKVIRVLIVDDSPVARDILRDLLTGQDGIEVIAEAANGQEAVEMVEKLRPDLVTMDLNMPVMSGMEAIVQIMYNKAVPILVVSNESDAELAYQAISSGALEVIAKPRYTSEEADNFADKVRLLAGVSVITRMRQRYLAEPQQVAPIAYKPLSVMPSDVQQVFVIASSTGGPQALASLLPQLPADFPAPILIAQHISDGFIDGMAQWLSGLCQLPVKVAENGEVLRSSCVYLSPPEKDLTVTAGRCLALTQRNAKDIYRPSCDALLTSVADVFGSQAVGIIMTGMGRDGAKGMRAIYNKGGITLAQDEASSVIYGMNAEAVNLGVIQREIPLASIANEMLQIVGLPRTNERTLLSRGDA